MGAFKEELDAAAGRRLAAELRRAWPEFPARRFTAGLADELEALALLARVNALATRLERTLPGPFSQAADVLYRALESPTFTGWSVWPCGEFIARAGIEHPEIALPLLASLTPRWSSEFGVRPFIQRHRRRTYQYLRKWTASSDEHVRRLVSETTRPRLPWAPILRDLIADPSPNLPLLDALINDPSAYVRRSVANHINDISKDHPDVALDFATRWVEHSTATAWVVRHGLRSLIKRGDPDALAVIGADVSARIQLLDFSVDRTRVVVGTPVTLTFTIALTGACEASNAVIDYRVHYVGARGAKSPKVFKLTRRRLEPDRPVTIQRRHRFEHVSVRRIHVGSHRIDLQVNGRIVGSTEIDVVEPD